MGLLPPAHAADITPFSPSYKAFSNNMGGMVYEARVTQDLATFDGNIAYGGNSPAIYLGVMASLSKPAAANIEPWYDIHRVKVSVTIKDSQGNILNPGDQNYPISYRMWDTPHDTATDQDFANEFGDLVQYFQNLELSLVIPYPIPDLPPGLKLPQPFNGVASDTSSVWAQWATYNPHQAGQMSPFNTDPYHSVKLLVQPNFPKPDAYQVSVSVEGERGSCLAFDLSGGYSIYPYSCGVDETISSSYSFQYVYEADANSPQVAQTGDASNNLPKDGGTPRSILHGSYTGFLYGTDTADVYSFYANPSEKIAFKATSPPLTDFGLAVYDPTQTTQIGVQDLGPGATNTVSFTASPNGGTYFATIFLTSGSGTYSFRLSDAFQISANPMAVSLGIVGTGSSPTSTITISSPTDFSGLVSLSTSISPVVTNGPSASLQLVTTSSSVNPSSWRQGGLTSGALTNPTNAYVNDGNFATLMNTAGNTNCSNGGCLPMSAWYSGFSQTSLPSDAKILKVEMGAQHYETSNVVNALSCNSGCPTAAIYMDSFLGSRSHGWIPIPSTTSVFTGWIDVTDLTTSWTPSSVNGLTIEWYLLYWGSDNGYSYLDWNGFRITYTTTSVTLTPGSSVARVLTITGSPATPAGSYTVTVTATSGPTSFSVPVAVNVQDFQITASPASLNVIPGQTGTTSITAYGLNGFTGTVTLSDIVPSGLFCSGFSQYTISLSSTTTSGTSTLSCNGQPGPYSLSVTGTSGFLQRSTLVAFNVTDFTLTANTTSMTFPASSSGNATIDVSSLYGFTGLMNLTYTTPPGLTCDPPINIEPTDPETMTCSGSPGTYTVTVTATSGATMGAGSISLSHSVQISVTVQDFSISPSPTSLTILPGASGSSTVTVSSLGGFLGTVTVSATPSPSSGLTCSFSSTSIPNGAGTSILSCNGVIGTYTVTVTGMSASLRHSATVQYVVQDFGISVSPASVTVLAGQTGTSTVTVTMASGTLGTVSLAANPSPSTGLVCSLSPTSLTSSGTSTLYCYGSIGSYTVAITATGGSSTHSVQVTFTIRDFTLTATPSTINIPDGRSGTVTVQATSLNGYSGSISLGISLPPYCSTYSFSKPTLQLSSGGTDTATLTLNIGATCYANQYNSYVTGYDGVAGVVRYGSFTINVSDFSIYATIGTNVGIAGQYTLKYNVTYNNNNNYAGSILTQTQTWGPNNCCLSTTIPATFSLTKPDSISAAGVVTQPNVLGQPFAFPWDGSGFYAQGRDWVFFITSSTCAGTTTNCLYYATSTNGVTWTIYNTNLVTGGSPSIITDGARVFYARYNGLDSQSGKPIMFGLGTLHTDGTIAWQPETTVKPAASGVYWYHLSMGISTTGQVFIAYQRATSSGGSGLPYVIHSNGLDYTTWQQETLLINSSDDWRFSLVPLPSGQMYILYWPFWGVLRGQFWSNNAWGAQETVTPANTYVQQNAFGFSNGNNTVYTIWQERTSQKLQFAIRTGSWGSPQTIAMADTGTNPHWTASYDPLHRKWYVVYYSTAVNQVYEYSGQPGSWSTKTVLFNTLGASSNTFIGSFYNSGQVNTSTNTLGIFWTQYDSSSHLELMFANETIFTGGSIPATWPISSTGAGSGTTSLTITASDGYITRSLTIQLTINGYNVTYWYNPVTVNQGGSSGLWLQIFPEYGIPLTNVTVFPVTVPICLTVYSLSPKYVNIGPIGGYDFPFLPIGAASSCGLGNYQVTVKINGTLVHTYDKQLTFTVTVQSPPPPGGGGSIAHGSLITMADGSKVPVQNLKVGDQILGYDTATGKYTLSIVTSIKTVKTGNMLIIHTASGTPFRVDANPAQTLWVKTSSGTIDWLSVTLIKPGDYLYTVNGWTPVTSIEFAPAGNHVMYDITSTTPYFADGYLDPIHKL